MNVEKPELVNALATVLADSVVLSFRLQGAHWNVVGQDFTEYHSFFAAIYEDIDGSIDPLAENIRKLGSPAPASLEDFLSLTTLPTGADYDFTTASLASSVHNSIEIAIANVNSALKVATSVDEQGIANFLADRDDMLKKWRWQLSSSLYGN